MKKLIILSLLFLYSCASGSPYKIVVLPDGKKGFTITCYEERDHCEREAEKLCDNNYKVHEFKYKQSLEPMENEPVTANTNRDVEEDLVSVFEMTVSCEVID